jgi:hypothetical protein
MIVLAVGSVDTETSNTSSSSTGISSVTSRKWYEGGTLHKKSALEWQSASSDDKLATCGDFVTALWKKGGLKPSITSKISAVDDVRPFALELVACLDAAFKPDSNAKKNHKLFANQTVSETAVACMIVMEWTE